MQNLSTRSRRTALLSLLAGVAVSTVASAQISIQMRSDRDMFLTFESIPVTVSIRNFSGRNIQIEEGQESWLDFLVTDETGAAIAATGHAAAGGSALIPAGQTVGRKVDLLALYDLRSPGSYRVQALVDSGGQKFVSSPLKFTISNGREIWTQTLGLPPKDNAPDEYRTYQLINGKVTKVDTLYVCVREEAKNTIYGMLALGDYLSMSTPEVVTDKAGHLHVLFRNGPRSFNYAEIDGDANIVNRAVYTDVQSRPGLANGTNGLVVVRGGEKVWPRAERMMTDAELHPLPPPPPPAKKKRWWQ